jgi:serine protease Do
MPPKRRTGLLLLIMALLLSASGGAWLENHYDDAKTDSLSIGAQPEVVTSRSRLISEIVKKVGPSVVSIDVSVAAGGDAGLFGLPAPEQRGAGTGIIISAAGIVMTNRHVVPAGTSKVLITLSDGTELRDVSVIGRTGENDNLDIAFLKINNTLGHKLKPAVIGNSAAVQVGEDVVAIGNALGQFQNTVTSGIISGYGRSVEAGDSSDAAAATESLDNLFQTDAAINPGNSGGPLVNLSGQVIGINTAIAGDAQNIGFAIPVNDVRGLVQQVIKTGKFARPYLGVRYLPLTADLAKAYKLRVNNGAFITPSTDPAAPSVLPDSPADRSGLQAGDVITKVGDTAVDQTHSLTSLLAPHQPGERVKLTVVRGTKTLHPTVTLGAMPAEY